MSKKRSKDDILTTFTNGSVKGTVFLARNPYDGYQYAAWEPEPLRLSANGKPLQGQTHYFAYDESDFIATLKQCTAFINRYNNNPERAMREARRTQQQLEELAA